VFGYVYSSIDLYIELLYTINPTVVFDQGSCYFCEFQVVHQPHGENNVKNYALMDVRYVERTPEFAKFASLDYTERIVKVIAPENVTKVDVGNQMVNVTLVTEEIGEINVNNRVRATAVYVTKMMVSAAYVIMVTTGNTVRRNAQRTV